MGKKIVKKKVKNLLFVISKSGRSTPRISFYEGSKVVPREKVNVVFKKGDTGRFVTRTLGRDSRTGQFVTAREAERHPRTSISERVPKPGYGDVAKHSHKKERIDPSSPVYFRKK